MAKLTAKFDLEDKISKKLKTISDNAEKLERSRDRLNKPMTLEVKDKATRALTRIHKFVLKDIAKTHRMLVAVRDRATRPLNKINAFMKRRMPRTHEILVRARDRAKSVLEKIRRYASKHLSKPYMLMVMAKDRAMPTLHKIANYAKRQLSRGYNFSVRAIDIATKTVGRIASFARTAIPKYRDFTIRAWDRATSIVGSVKRALFSIPTMITVTLGVIGAGKLKDATLGAAMDFEGYEVGAKHWLDGNEKKANELIEWMREYTNKTPFDSPDLFPALTRGIGVADGDVGEAKSLLKIATDMAALTPNRTVEDAMEALADARMGEFQTLKGFNMKMTQDDFEKIGWSGFIDEARSKFEGGAEEYSKTARGLISKLTGYITASFREAGDGMLEAMKPRLQKMSNWIDENGDKWMEWRDTVQKMGEQAGEWAFSKLENGFEYIRDNYLENDKFKELDFEGKVKFIMEDLNKWWNEKGMPLMVQVSKDVGVAIFNGMKWGIKEGAKGIGNMWLEAAKDPSVENFGSAGLATLLGGSIMSLVLTPLLRAYRVLKKMGKIALDIGKWGAGLLGFGKGKGIPPIFGGKGKGTKQPKPKKPDYRHPWFSKGQKPDLNEPNQGKKAPKGFKLPKGLGNSLGKLANFGKRIPVIGSVIGGLSLLSAPSEDKAGVAGSLGGGILGGALGGGAAGSLFGGVGAIPGSIIGGIAGAFGGESLVDWLTSNWGSIKTKAGQAGTWIADSFIKVKDVIAETIFSGSWWSEKWSKVKGWASDFFSTPKEWMGNVTEHLSKTLFDKHWWADMWDYAVYLGFEAFDRAVEWGSGILDIIKETVFNPYWWIEQAGFVFGYLEETLFSGEWWAEKWGQVVEWASEYLEPIGEAFNYVKDIVSETIFNSEWWAEKWEQVSEWAMEQIKPIAGVFLYVKDLISDTIFNSEWWMEKWESVKEWTQEKWDSAVEIWNSVVDKLSDTIFNSEWWMEKWDSVKEWTQEKWDSAVEIWNSVTEKIAETIFSAEWWLEKWEAVKGWTQDKWDSAVDVWNSVTDKISETIFSADWWLGKWESVKGWTSDKWETAKSIWTTVRDGISETLFSAEWWTGKWNDVVAWGKKTLGGIGDWVGDLIQDTKAAFGAGREKGKDAATSSRPVESTPNAQNAATYARGGMINHPHLGLVGEDGPEMIIPLSSSKRGRAMDLYNQTGKMLGVKPYAQGGLAGKVSSDSGSQSAAVSASVNVNKVNAKGIGQEAEQYGNSFTSSVAEGINEKVVPIDNWKQNNITNPMHSVVGEAAGFGSRTVRSFSESQNETPTNTANHLNNQVKNPFRVIEGGAGRWGSGTISKFREGQNSTDAGTRPYLASNVDAPFNSTRAKGSGWGSGTMSAFISGMRSKSNGVAAASKELARMVDKTFKKELGIASPAKAMVKNGMWTAMGIVKGLKSVDIKAVTKKRIDDMMAAFSGMGSGSGSVKKWLLAAMSATGAPASWLDPLSTIAMKESGGKTGPSTVNKWDSNWARGTPSMGLMQTIQPTFDAHKKGGMNDIMNPVHNAVAAINYIKSRYGTPFNTPGIKSMAAGGGYKGYWRGTDGPLRQGETAWVGERGPELMHIPGGAEIFSNPESKKIASGQLAAANGSSSVKVSQGSGKGDVVIQFNGDNHFYDEDDMDKFTDKVKRAVEKILNDEYAEGGEMVVYD